MTRTGDLFLDCIYERVEGDTSVMSNFDYHSLRHTHAQMLRNSGTPDIYIQKRLGHAKIDITINVYASRMTEMVKKAGQDKVDELFNISVDKNVDRNIESVKKNDEC